MTMIEEQTGVPQNVEAERAVLGAILVAPASLPHVRETLEADDFYQPRNAAIFAAAARLADAGKPVDVLTIAAECIGQRDIHPYLHSLYADTPTASNVGYWVEFVKDAAQRRRFIEVASRISQAASTESVLGPVAGQDSLRDLAAKQLIELEMLVEDRGSNEPITDLFSWDEFLNQPRPADDWVVPGQVARDDVVMILGGEGAGKSWISRQYAMCLPSGIHPFKPQEQIPPMRTMLVDLEVAKSTLIDEAAPLAHQVARFGEWNLAPSFVWHHPEGLNLRDPHDQREFERRIAIAAPDAIFFGSLYNAYQTGRDSHEQVADELKAFFNKMRTRYRCALWLEHHMPKGDGQRHRPATPYGSSVWQRWITHGRAMQRINETTFELVNIREGDRGRREFPAGIYRGGSLPVSPIWSDEEVHLLREASNG